VVSKAKQKITSFPRIPNQSVGARPFAVTAPTASSGLPVTLSVVSGPAVISNGMVTVTGPGTVVVAAMADGNEQYAAAPQVTTSFTVK
jgi:hypothetical protein